MFLLALAFHASANSLGYIGQSQTGCTSCHGSRGEATTTAYFSASTPTTVTPGETISLTFYVDTTSTRSGAGFNVAAEAGTLTSGTGSKLMSGELTQTNTKAMSSSQATFTFSWTAPTEIGTYHLYGTGLAVNSDRGQNGDGWDLAPSIAIEVDDGCFDVDADGYRACPTGESADCNDHDATIHPGAREICDGRDQDCNGTADDNPSSPYWYVDADGDGYGDPATGAGACTRPDGGVADGTDCDDADVAVGPAPIWYADLDGDTFGDASDPLAACTQPDSYVTDTSDCDDSDDTFYPGAPEYCDIPLDNNCDGVLTYVDADHDGWGECTECDDTVGTTYPGATEACNGVDDDCDGNIDGAASTGSPTWYRDADGDGYGDAATTTVSCGQPSGYVADATDCNDAASSIRPGGTEVCGGSDEDCDGLEGSDDPSTTGTTAYYADLDGDGYGDRTSSVRACELPADYASNQADCDDTHATTYPSAPELCDGLDNNCDGAIDNGTTGTNTWYADGDGDGYGDSATVLVICTAPPGWSLAGGDCDDDNASSNPGRAEVWYNGVDEDCDGRDDDQDADGYGYATDCADTNAAIHPDLSDTCDGTDNDCDGRYDEDGGTSLTYYYDGDRDGYGVSSPTIRACAAPSGYAATSTDCNDANAAAHPGATEVWYNGVDEDCDGRDDDQDRDGYPKSTDCNDLTARVHPGLPDTCDAADTDCDGVVDEDGTGFALYYLDADGDGYGADSTALGSCTALSGYITVGGDCNDTSIVIHAGATEVWYDGIDQDCDGNDTDQDGDSYANDVDCADTDANRHPGAAERCNGVDDDCNGVTDEGAADAVTYYTDTDGDGYGDSSTAVATCTRPPSSTTLGDDCNDGATSVNPAATETWYDGIDQNCDGNDTDQDGDGWIYTADCDDTLAAAHPGAAEIWYDGIDEACDGGDDDDQDADGHDADRYGGDDCDDLDDTIYAGANDPWYDGVDSNCDSLDDYDADADGHPSASYGGDDCDDANATVYPGAPPIADDGIDNNCGGDHPDDADDDGYFSSVDDCDDANSSVHPGVEEIWYDGIDQDCDGNDADQDLDGVTAPDDCDDLDPTTSPAEPENYYDGVDQNCTDADEYDADGDGHNSASYGGDDCDDARGDTWPGAPDEPYDGIINDCDAADEYDSDADGFEYSVDCDDSNSAITSGTVWYRDGDGDGWGDSHTTIVACTQPNGYVSDSHDCNDTSSRTNPEATERWYDGEDSNCDGKSDYDQDQDGHDSDLYGGDDCDDQDFGIWEGCDTGGETGVADDTAVDTGDTDSGNNDSGDPDSGDPDSGDSAWTPETGLVDTGGAKPGPYRECACASGSDAGNAAGGLAALGWAAAVVLARRRQRQRSNAGQS